MRAHANPPAESKAEEPVEALLALPWADYWRRETAWGRLSAALLPDLWRLVLGYLCPVQQMWLVCGATLFSMHSRATLRDLRAETLEAYEDSVKDDSVAVLHWLRATRPLAHLRIMSISFTFSVMCAREGALESLKWGRAQDPPCYWGADTCAVAARRGRLDLLQWLRAQDPPCPWDAFACAYAAEGGSLEALQWLRAQDPPCPWDEWACVRAVRGGRLETLRWLRAQRPPCPWDAGACVEAAEGGQLEILQWLRAQNPPCPWHEDACAAAATWGRLETLQWLRAQNPPCPWDGSTTSGAHSTGHHEIARWAYDNGCRAPEEDSDVEDFDDTEPDSEGDVAPA